MSPIITAAIFLPRDEGRTVFVYDGSFNPPLKTDKQDSAIETAPRYCFRDANRIKYFTFRELTNFSRTQISVYQNACANGDRSNARFAESLHFIGQIHQIRNDLKLAKRLSIDVINKADAYITELTRINRNYHTLEKELKQEAAMLTIAYDYIKKFPVESASPLWSNPFTYLGIATCGISSIVGAVCFGGGLASLALATTSVFGFLKLHDQGKNMERAANRTEALAVIKNTIADNRKKALYLYEATKPTKGQPTRKPPHVRVGAMLQA